MLQGLRVDFDRLWKNLPQVPDPEMGLPFTGPLDPLAFCFPPCEVVGTGGTNSLTPLFGTAPEVPSGTRPPGGCATCGDSFYFTMSGLTQLGPYDVNLLNGNWQLYTAEPENCTWASDRVSMSGSNPNYGYWMLEAYGAIGGEVQGFTLRGYLSNPPFEDIVMIQYTAGTDACPLAFMDLDLVYLSQFSQTGTGNPYDVPNPLRLTAGTLPP